jgi:hypothetical protein
MRKIASLAGRDLRWVQPHALKMEYELLDGDLPAATLRFRSSFGSFATAESADGRWTFKRVGFWQTRATIRAEGSDREIAAFRNATWRNGGSLELPDGRRYLASNNFWMTQFALTTVEGEALVSYRKVAGVLHMSADVTIAPPAAVVAEMPWLVAFGWYLAVMAHLDSSSVAAAGS